MKSVKPPKYARENARKALKCLDSGSDAMLRVGRLRARQLAAGRPLGEVSLRKISQFKRHQKNAEYSGDICKDDGSVAWLGWGYGYKDGMPNPRFSEWAKRKLKKIKG